MAYAHLWTTLSRFLAMSKYRLKLSPNMDIRCPRHGTSRFFRACNRRTNIVMLDSSYHQPLGLNVKMPNEPRFFLGRTWMSNRIDRRFVFTPLPKNVSSLSLSQTAINSLIVLNTQYFTLRTASVQPRFSKGLQREDQRGSQNFPEWFSFGFRPLIAFNLRHN